MWPVEHKLNLLNTTNYRGEKTYKKETEIQENYDIGVMILSFVETSLVNSFVNTSLVNKKGIQSHFKTKFWNILSDQNAYQNLEAHVLSETKLAGTDKSKIKTRALEMWADFVCFYYSVKQEQGEEYVTALSDFKSLYKLLNHEGPEANDIFDNRATSYIRSKLKPEHFFSPVNFDDLEDKRNFLHFPSVF